MRTEAKIVFLFIAAIFSVHKSPPYYSVNNFFHTKNNHLKPKVEYTLLQILIQIFYFIDLKYCDQPSPLIYVHWHFLSSVYNPKKYFQTFLLKALSRFYLCLFQCLFLLSFNSSSVYISRLASFNVFIIYSWVSSFTLSLYIFIHLHSFLHIYLKSHFQ